MVAVADRMSTSSLPITLSASGEASGLANIVGQYVEQILADSPEKRAEAAALRGRLGLHAREGDVAVTVAFTDDGVVIEEGLHKPDAVIAGEVEFLMHMLAGRCNPIWELGGRHVAIRPNLRRPLFAFQAYHLLRLPDVHVWSGLPRPPVPVLVGAAAIVGLAIVIRRSGKAKAGS